MRTLLLNAVQQRSHSLAQGGVQMLGVAGWRQRPARRHDHRDLLVAHIALVVFGPDPLGTPDDQRDRRNSGLQRHPGRSGLELLELEGATNRRLRHQADQLAGPQQADGFGVRPRAGPAVDRDRLGVLDQEVDHLHLLHLRLDQVADAPPASLDSKRSRQPVHVAGVVDRDHRATG
jgi:hypothetical protein